MPQPDSELDWKSFGLAFSYRLREVRRQRQMSQEKLAELTGLHRNQISNLERNTSRDDGSGDPLLSTVYRLAQALEVAPSVLLPDHNDLVRSTARKVASDFAWNSVQIELNTATRSH